MTCLRRRTPDVLVLSLGYRPNIGGLETFLDDFVRHALALKKRVAIATLQPFTTAIKAASYERSPGLTVRRQRWFGNGLFLRLVTSPTLAFLYTFPAVFLTALRAKIRESPKVVFPQGLVAGAVAIFLFPRKRRVLAIHSDLSFSSSKAAPFVRAILSRQDAVLCLSDLVTSQALRLGAPQRSTHSFTYWIDLQRFDRSDQQEARQELGLPPGFITLFAGRFIEEKGVKVALGAAAKLKDRGITFAFAGTGPEEQAIRERVSSAGNVRLLGALDSERLALAYSAADALLVPSVSEEGFGRVIIEALACGLPVVGARRGGIPEAISSEVGLLVEPDTGVIAESLLALATHPDRCVAMSSKARSFAVERYSEGNARVLDAVLFD